MPKFLLRICFLWVGLIGTSGYIIAQSDIDSLEKQLQVVEAPKDSLNILYSLTRHFASRDNELGFKYSDIFLRLARREKDSSQIVRAYLMRGLCLVFSDKLEEAKSEIRKIADYSFSHESELAVQTGQYLGNINRSLGYLDSAQFYYNKALSNVTDSSTWYNMQKSLASLEYSSGKVTATLERLHFVLEYERRLGKSRIASTCNNIAVIYSNRNESQKANKFYLMAIEESKKVGDETSRSMLTAQRGAARTYLEIGELENAKLHLNNAYLIYESFDNPSILSQLYFINGELLVKEGKVDSAAIFYNQLIALAESIQFREQKLNAIVNYLHFQFQQDNYDVDRWINELESDDLEVNLSMKKSINEILNQYYLQKLDYKKSRYFLEQYWVTKDSIEGLEQENYISELETKYETEKKDTEIASLSQQAQIQALELSQRNTQLVVAGVALLLVVLAGFIFYQQRKYKHQQAVSDIEQRMLRLQMNPHFIFNALSSIQNYILQSDTKESVKYLAKFGKLMRQILEHSREEFITLEEEVDMLTNYLQIQQLRFADAFDYQIKVSEELNQSVVKIPPLFAQPLVENAIEHGLAGLENGLVTISFSKTEGGVSLQVADNGRGMNVESKSISEHKSLASVITRERLDILSSRFKTRFTINFQSQKELGTSVHLIIPYSE